MSLDVYMYVRAFIIEEFRIEEQCVFTANITHNLGAMAEAAGIYDAIWHPRKRTRGKRLIPVLTEAIERMEQSPEVYKQYNAPNGWGLYKNFLPWLKALLQAAVEHPRAWYEVSR